MFLEKENKEQELLQNYLINEERSSLRDIVNIFFRQKWKIILFFVLTFAGVTLYTYIQPEIFQSNAKLLFKEGGPESISADPAIQDQKLSGGLRIEQMISAELAILGSRYLAEKVVDKFGPAAFITHPDEALSNNPYQEDLRKVRRNWRYLLGYWKDKFVKVDLVSDVSQHRSKAIKNFMNSIKISSKNTPIIDVSFDSQNPQFSQEVLKNLIDYFLEYHIKVYSKQASLDFLSLQNQKLLSDLNKKEKELEQHNAKNDIVSLDEQKTSLLNEMSSIQTNIDNIVSEIDSSKTTVDSLEILMKDPDQAIELYHFSSSNSGNNESGIRDRLLELRLKKADIESRYPEDERLLSDLDKQINVTKDAIKHLTRSAIETEKVNLKSLIAKKKAMENEYSSRKNKLAELTNHEITITRLQRDVDIFNKEYLNSRDKLAQATILENLEKDKISNIKIVEPATLPFENYKPKKMKIIGLGFFMAFFGGLSLAFILDYFDDSLKNKRDVEKKLGLTVLTTIPFKKEIKKCI